MTIEKLEKEAEETVKRIVCENCNKCQSYGYIGCDIYKYSKNAYIAGAKENGVIWHDLTNNNEVFKKKEQNVNEKKLLKAKADYYLVCNMATWSRSLYDYKQYGMESWHFKIERFVNKHNARKLPNTERVVILGTEGHPKTFEINYKTLEITEVE